MGNRGGRICWQAGGRPGVWLHVRPGASRRRRAGGPTEGQRRREGVRDVAAEEPVYDGGDFTGALGRGRGVDHVDAGPGLVDHQLPAAVLIHSDHQPRVPVPAPPRATSHRFDGHAHAHTSPGDCEPFLTEGRGEGAVQLGELGKVPFRAWAAVLTADCLSGGVDEAAERVGIPVVAVLPGGIEEGVQETGRLGDDAGRGEREQVAAVRADAVF